MEPKPEKSLSKFLTSEPLKKMIAQLLLSLSIFSFVFSYFLCSSSVFQPRNSPSLPFNLRSHAVNKNYIFLICNALLVFLSKTSGLVHSSSGFDLNDMLQKRVVGDGLLAYNSFETKEPFRQRPKEEHEEDEWIPNEETKEISMESDEDHVRHDNFEADHDETHEKESEKCLLSYDDINEEDGFTYQDEVAEDEGLSTEELNKKFEDFIRKTKEEIMINEARQLVIAKCTHSYRCSQR